MSPIRFVNAPGLESQPLDRAPAQQPAMSYVNLHATRAEFERVLARLSASHHLSPLDPPSLADAPAAAQSPHANQPSSTSGLLSWGNLLSGLLGGGTSSTSSHGHSDTPAAAFSHDDGSPLSRAVVMFTATWCGPCSVVHKELRQAVRKLDGRPACAIIVVDVEANKELATELGVKALPTLLYLGRDGARGPIYTQGPVSASAILDTMDRASSFGGRDLAAKWLKL